MEIYSKLVIGDKLSLAILDNDINTKVTSMLSTQLIDIDEEYIYISAPAYKGKKYSLVEKQVVTIFFYRSNGIYKFNAMVSKRSHNDNVYIFSLEIISETTKIQRRNYYRLPIVVPIVIKVEEENTFNEYMCFSKDLSAGGTKVLCNKEIDISTTVFVDVYIEDDEIITMYGEIIRSVRVEENDSYELGIEFKGSNDGGIDKIFAFIFEKQRLLRKKGLV